jgi:hypothetical protein
MFKAVIGIRRCGKSLQASHSCNNVDLPVNQSLKKNNGNRD